MGFRGEHGFVYILYHVPTGLHYLGADATNRMFAERIMWSTYFTTHPLVLHLIKVFGADTFQFKILREYPTTKEAILLVRRWNRRFKPHIRLNWIVDVRRKQFRKSRKNGKGNPQFYRRGREHNRYGVPLTPSQRMRYAEAKREVWRRIKFKWCVDDRGIEKRVPPEFVLPLGWRWGRNVRTWSRW